MSEKKRQKVYREKSFVSYLTGRATTREPIASWQVASRQWWEAVRPSCDLFVSEHVLNEIPTFDTPIDEIYWIRQQISAEYDHDPHKYFLAMVEEQKRLAREGQVFWGYNADGELAPLPMEAICGA